MTAGTSTDPGSSTDARDRAEQGGRSGRSGRVVRRPIRTGAPGPAVGGPTRTGVQVSGDVVSESARRRLALVQIAALRARASRWTVVPGAPDGRPFVPGEPPRLLLPTGVTPRRHLAARLLTDQPSAAPAPALRPPRRRGRVQLTRRGEVVLQGAVVLLIALAVVVGALLAGGGGAAGSGADPAYQVAVSVQPGETLTGIARRVVPDADPAQTVQAILAANGLSAADADALQPGQRIVVPVP